MKFYAYAILAVFVASRLFFRNGWMLGVYAAAVVSFSVYGHQLAPEDRVGVNYIAYEGRIVAVAFLMGVLAHRLSAHIWLCWGGIAAALGVIVLACMFAGPVFAPFPIMAALAYILLCAAYLGKSPKGPAP